MTKLFTRVFASLPDDVKVDEQLSEKMSLVQQFVRPENLDIKPTFQNETSWLVSQSLRYLTFQVILSIHKWNSSFSALRNECCVDSDVF